MKSVVRAWAEALLVTAAFAILAYFYLLPATRYWVQGRTDLFLSNGNDSLTFPTQIGILVRAFRERPSLLLYGTVHTTMYNPPAGTGLWIPWIDRILLLVGAGVAPLEAVPAFYAWALSLLNGAAFYACGRIQGWKKPACFGLALAFAFNPYTRARLAVHPSLAALYFLPLVFLAIRLIQTRKGWKSGFIASLSLLGAITTAHYYWMILIALLPVLAIQALWRQRYWRRILVRLAIASIPALFLLGWSVSHPLPPDLVQTGVVQSPTIHSYFLVQFAARPIDYLGQDLMFGLRDWNPARRALSEWIVSHLDTSNAWERTNGIRWSLLLAFIGATAVFARRKSREAAFDAPTRTTLATLLLFTFAAFWLSLSPRSLAPGGHGIGPSLWVHALLPNFRVPSRFGPVVHFGLLLFVGTAFEAWRARARRPASQVAVILLPFLMILDYPPLEAMPMQPALPRLLSEECGAGFFVPTLSGEEIGPAGESTTYRWIERLRGTSCSLLGGGGPTAANSSFRAAFASVPGSSSADERLLRFVECSGTSWIGFTESLDRVRDVSDRARLCAKLGFEQEEGADVCRSRAPRALNPHWETCTP